MTMRNCSVAGNISDYPALSSLPFQAPYPLEFVRESRRAFSGHYGIMPTLVVRVVGLECIVEERIYALAIARQNGETTRHAQFQLVEGDGTDGPGRSDRMRGRSLP